MSIEWGSADSRRATDFILPRVLAGVAGGGASLRGLTRSRQRVADPDWPAQPDWVSERAVSAPPSTIISRIKRMTYRLFRTSQDV